VIDFELVLPEGWVVLPTTPDTERARRAAIEEIVRRFLPKTLPRDRAEPWRRELRRQLLAATDDAARNGARSVVLPLSTFNGVRIPGSMLLTLLEDADPQDPERLLASILAEAGPAGSYHEIGGAPAARIAAVVQHPTLGDDNARGHRVSYYLSHPDVPGVWGLLTFTVLAVDGDPDTADTRAVVFLFDSIVSTLRWVDRDAFPTEDEMLAAVVELSGAP
jgi:hypothetical protein